MAIALLYVFRNSSACLGCARNVDSDEESLANDCADDDGYVMNRGCGSGDVITNEAYEQDNDLDLDGFEDDEESDCDSAVEDECSDSEYVDNEDSGIATTHDRTSANSDIYTLSTAARMARNDLDLDL